MSAVHGRCNEPRKRFTSEEVLSYFLADESVKESDDEDNLDPSEDRELIE